MENHVIESKIESVESHFSVRCHIHSRYKGLRKPRTDCQNCWEIYRERKNSGTTERRIRVAGRGTEQRQELSTESTHSYVEHITDVRADDNGTTVFKDVAERLYKKNREKLLGY